MSDISKNIKLHRRKNNFSQEQLAAQLKVTRQTISNWETDKSYPDLDMVVRLAEILNTDPNNLLYPPETKKKTVAYRPVSFKPILITFVVFFFSMTWGGGLTAVLFQKICGGGVQETYLYPIYGGIILLAVLIATCTCVIIEELRNLNRKENSNSDQSIE